MPATDALRLDRSSAIRDEWVALGAEIARLEARRLALMAERFDILLDLVPSGSRHHDVAFRSVAAEFSAAGDVSQTMAEGAFYSAHTVMHHLPQTARALADGLISARHVAVIVSAARGLEQPDAAAYAAFESDVIEAAAGETPARTGAHAKLVAAAVSGETIAVRHKRAREHRTVELFALDDGMAQLVVTAPELLLRAAFDRVTSISKNVLRDRAAGLCDELPIDPSVGDGGGDLVDERTMAQVRADIAVDLLVAARPESVSSTALEGVTANVQVTIGASTLAGDDDRMAELDGFGPVHPDLVRSLAGDTPSWSRLYLDPAGLAVATDNYVPTAAMKRFLRARDQHCRFPGCRMPVHRCDIDHNHGHARGGPTSIDNLSHFCRGHHALKHPDIDDRFRWTATQLPGGVIVWSSPGGVNYTDEPSRRVLFL